MQDIGELVSRTRLTGMLVIALILSACSGGSVSSSGASSTAAASTAGTSGSGTATLSWNAPTDNSDGAPITGLAGYYIYYGTNADDLTQSIEVSGAASTTYEVKSLAPGTYYFAVTAYDSTGLQSEQSNVGSITIG